ncbi:MAG: PH domain-containing protein [Candidatus Zhuqueibacterota bacterium]
MDYIFPKMTMLIVVGIMMILGGLFIMSLARAGAMSIKAQQVVLKVPMYKEKRIPASQVKEARIVELKKGSDYYPVAKKSGSAVRNFRSGWFKLRNKEKAFLLVEGKQAIYLKTQAGDVFMIGINDFDRLVEVYRHEIGQLAR